MDLVVFFVSRYHVYVEDLCLPCRLRRGRVPDVQLERCPGEVKHFVILSWWILQLYLRWKTVALLRQCLMFVFRPASESLTDRLALMDYEARRLLSAIVKNVVQMTAEDLEPTNDDSRYTLGIISQVPLVGLS